MGARMFLELTEALLSSQMAATSALVALEDTFLRAFTFVIGKLNDEGYTKDFDVWSQTDLCMIANATRTPTILRTYISENTLTHANTHVHTCTQT